MGPSGPLLASPLSLCSLSGRKGQTLIHLAAKRGRTAAGRPLRHREKTLRKGSERFILTEKMRQSRPRGHPCLPCGCGPVGTSCLKCRQPPCAHEALHPNGENSCIPVTSPPL